MRRFYCENCGEEVDERDELCRSCGAIFVAIKCPRCGYRGKQHEFSRGCPRCGYLSETPSDRSGDRSAGFSQSVSDRRGAERVRERRPMPAWLFWVVLSALAVAFVVLARIYASL